MYGWATSYPFTCWINAPICAILIHLHCVPQQLEERERNWVGFTGCVLHKEGRSCWFQGRPSSVPGAMGAPLSLQPSLCRDRRGSGTSLCGVQKARQALGHLSLLWGFQQQAAPDPRGWLFSRGQGCPGLCGCGHWKPELPVCLSGLPSLPGFLGAYL